MKITKLIETLQQAQVYGVKEVIFYLPTPGEKFKNYDITLKVCKDQKESPIQDFIGWKDAMTPVNLQLCLRKK